MKIRKWYEVSCDYEECEAAIGHYAGDTIKEVLEQVRDDNAVIRYIPGKRKPLIFCDEECCENWAKAHGYEVKFDK